MKCLFLILALSLSNLLRPTRSINLTVAEALSFPSSITIQNRLASRGISGSNPNTEKMLLEQLTAILQGTYVSTNKIESETTPVYDYLQTTLSGLLSAKELSTFKKGIIGCLKTFVPSLTSTLLLRNIAKTCASVHKNLKHQKNIVRAQERDLSSSYIVGIAHSLALEAVVKLVLIVYSPQAMPCERMHALYLLNSTHLLGNKGELFKRWRNRTNRFYFSPQGKLIEFDPSSNNSHIPKRLKALNNCLKILAQSHEEYVAFLSAGISAGITQLREYLHHTPWVQKKNQFLWIYAAEFFKEATAFDVMYIRTVDPSRIFSHQENRDLLALMLIISSGNNQEVFAHDSAQKFLESRKQSSSAPLLKRYYFALTSPAKH